MSTHQQGIAAACVSEISIAPEQKLATRFLPLSAGGDVIALPRPRFAVWQSVTLGKCANVESYYRRLLREAGRSFDGWTHELLRRESFPCAEGWAQCKLVLASVRDLGFGAGARYREICTRAEEVGLALCPAEIGPALRLQYAGRPLEWIGIGMRPIEGWNSQLFIFALTSRPNHGLLLCGYYSHPDYFWDADHLFVFSLKE